MATHKLRKSFVTFLVVLFFVSFLFFFSFTEKFASRSGLWTMGRERLAPRPPVKEIDQRGEITPQSSAKKGNDSTPLKKKSGYASALEETYMYWPKANRPGVYRACVPRPKIDSLSEVLTGGRIENAVNMTIIHCISKCTKLRFTYAALSRGSECFCSNVNRQSTGTLLNYTASAFCDVPCPGEPKYHCGGQEYMSLYRTSVPDSRCSKSVPKPASALPLIALASFPRSGNTWTRQLIERATGVITGSLAETSNTVSYTIHTFQYGRMNHLKKRAICIKTHRTGTKWFAGGILLIRNPYRSIVAEVFRRGSVRSKTMAQSLEYFKSPAWKPFVTTRIERWHDIAVQWITQSPRIHVAHYEDLEENTYDELAKIVRFLNVTVQPQRLLCAIQECPSSKLTMISLGALNRERRVYLNEDPYSAQLRKLVDQNIEAVNQTLISHKLKPLPRYGSVEVF